MKTPHRIGRFLEHDRGERNPLNTHSLLELITAEKKERERERGRNDASRWIEFQRTIDAIDRPTSRETPLTPKKYEFLSSQMENRWTFLEYMCIYIYISTRDCSTRFLLSNAFLRISRYFHDPKGWILLCTGESFCSRPDTSIV